jgi:hypothetical protein
MNNAKLAIAERIRAATIADSNQEGVNIAEGRFGSALASLCSELDGQHQGEPVALQHIAVSEGGKLRWMAGRKMQDCELYAMPYGSPINFPLYAEQPAPVSVAVLYTRIKELEAQSLAYYERAKAAEAQICKANDWSHIAPVAATPETDDSV